MKEGNDRCRKQEPKEKKCVGSVVLLSPSTEARESSDLTLEIYAGPKSSPDERNLEGYSLQHFTLFIPPLHKKNTFFNGFQNLLKFSK